MSGTVEGPGILTFRLPSPPPSMNSLYQIAYGKRQVFMKPEVRQYKTTMKLYVPQWELRPDEKVDAEFEVVDQWYFKNGNFRKLDVQNVLKVLIDLIAEKQAWCDSQVWQFAARKTHSDTERCVNVVLKKMGNVMGGVAVKKEKEKP